MIEPLWDDPEFEARHGALAKAETRRWESEQVAAQYEAFFRRQTRRDLSTTDRSR
jgi:hypothetical protein